MVSVTADRPAWFQGDRLAVHVNAEAAALLRDAFDRIARLDPTAPAAPIGLEVRLPDGRPLRLSVRLTDGGGVFDTDDAPWSWDGVACVDVAGDFEAHVAARCVVDAATRPYLEVPCSEQDAAALDAARVDQALDGRGPATRPLETVARASVRARALRAAARTRSQRLADARRRHPRTRPRPAAGPMTGIVNRHSNLQSAGMADPARFSVGAAAASGVQGRPGSPPDGRPGRTGRLPANQRPATTSGSSTRPRHSQHGDRGAFDHRDRIVGVRARAAMFASRIVDARVWSGHRFAARWWTRRSLVWRARAGGC